MSSNIRFIYIIWINLFLYFQQIEYINAWIIPVHYSAKNMQHYYVGLFSLYSTSTSSTIKNTDKNNEDVENSTGDTTSSSDTRKESHNVIIIGAGWGGLSTAHALSKHISSSNRQEQRNWNITIIESSKRVGGLVQDGYTTLKHNNNGSNRTAEAGMHGFWNNYYNIYSFLNHDMKNANGFDIKTTFTDYAEQGQYSPNGLQAIWPIYRDQPISLPTGLAQAIYTRFVHLPLFDLLSALPLVVAFSDFDDSIEAWERYDKISFYDLCKQLGVSQRCYDEAFEPMILTGLFAPGTECSAAAALGMAYFFVLQSQNAFDVQWCRGNIGNIIFDPWIKMMQDVGVNIIYDTRVTGFQFNQESNAVMKVICKNNNDGIVTTLDVDDVVFAVGAKALNTFIRNCPELAQFTEFRKFANLRGTSVLATRLFLDRNISIPYSANACWGFDHGIGMTVFDIGKIHGPTSPSIVGCQGSVLEVDYYHSSSLLVLTNDAIIAKVKADLDTIYGPECKAAKVVDAAIVRLPDAVNWYFPGSYNSMPETKSEAISNIYFAGDIVRTRHGSWSQEKAFVTGVEASNLILGYPVDKSIIPMANDESHVQLGRKVISSFRSLILSSRL